MSPQNRSISGFRPDLFFCRPSGFFKTAPQLRLPEEELICRSEQPAGTLCSVFARRETASCRIRSRLFAAGRCFGTVDAGKELRFCTLHLHKPQKLSPCDGQYQNAVSGKGAGVLLPCIPAVFRCHKFLLLPSAGGFFSLLCGLPQTR